MLETIEEEVYPDYRPAHLMLEESDPLRVYGYNVYTHPNPSDYFDLQEDFRKHLITQIKSFAESQKVNISEEETDAFQLIHYHSFLKDKGLEHHEFIAFISRYLSDEWCEKPYLKKLLADVEKRFGRKVGIYRRQVQYRVVRPHSLDNNPPHRDHWYPYFKPLINIYIPLAGSYHDSALPVVPFTHTATDEEIVPTFGYNTGQKTTKSNGVNYSVPEIKSSSIDLKFHRPDVPESNYMLFSPWSVHGGGSNGSNHTRFSFEIRLEFEGWE